MLNSATLSTNRGVLALSFILLNVLDLTLTLCILQAGGYELNPLIRSALAFGIPLTVFLKIGIGILFAWLLYCLRLSGALKVATLSILGICLFNMASLTLL
jgi:hypothetical protein